MEKKPALPTHGATSWSSQLKKGFRVTGWFKQGEIEEMVRTSAASSEAKDPFAGLVAGPIVVEDASLTAGDHARLSLNNDANPSLQPSIPGPGPGPGPGPLPAALTADRMSDKEMFAELDHSRSYTVIAGVLVGVAAIIATLCYFLL